MEIKMHNLLTVKASKKEYKFYNQVLPSILNKLQNFEKYNEFIAVGIGQNQNPAKSPKLDKFEDCYKLSLSDINSNPYSDEIFIEKRATIGGNNLDGKFITEIGITDGANSNPTIFNYFSLISDECPQGIFKESGKPIEIVVKIYLSIVQTGGIFLTSGENAFVKFLLGEGIASSEIFAVRGNLFTQNEQAIRENPTYFEKYPSKIETEIVNNDSQNCYLNITFSFDMKKGITREIVLICAGVAFARFNVTNFHETTRQESTFSSNENRCIDMNFDVGKILEIKSAETGEKENGFFIKKYADEFGDKISLPFSNFVNSTTPRFLSKDGDKIFFCVNDCVYGYKCENSGVSEIKSANLHIQNITKIIAFEKFVLIVSKTSPFISTFIIENNRLISAQNDFENKFDLIGQLADAKDIDLSVFESGLFSLGFIVQKDKSGIVLNFTFDETENKFLYDSSVKNSDYAFAFVVALCRSEFYGGELMFLKTASTSSNCRIVSYYGDKSTKDVYSMLAYYFSFETKQIKVFGRAVVVEKFSSPHIMVFFYPNHNRFTLELFENDLDDYFSTNMLYLAQKQTDGKINFFNLSKYTEARLFSSDINSYNIKNILSVEFVGNIVLLFGENEVFGLNLKEDKVLIENVSAKNSNYNICYEKYNYLGDFDEGVKVIAKSKVTV